MASVYIGLWACVYSHPLMQRLDFQWEEETCATASVPDARPLINEPIWAIHAVMLHPKTTTNHDIWPCPLLYIHHCIVFFIHNNIIQHALPTNAILTLFSIAMDRCVTQNSSLRRVLYSWYSSKIKYYIIFFCGLIIYAS